MSGTRPTLDQRLNPGAGVLFHNYTSDYVPDLLEDLKQLSPGDQSPTVEHGIPDHVPPGPGVPLQWLALAASSPPPGAPTCSQAPHLPRSRTRDLHRHLAGAGGVGTAFSAAENSLLYF